MIDPRPKVVLAYPDGMTDAHLAAIGDVSDVDLVHCRYAESYARRTARRRGDHLDDPHQQAMLRDSAFATVVADADVVFALDLPTELDSLAPRLRWLHMAGSGIEHLRTVRLPPDILITNSAGVSAVPIAEFVIGRLIAIWKNFPELAEQQREHHWQPMTGRSIAGKTLVVVGFGRIGQEIGRRARALGMQVIGIRRHPEPHPDADDVLPSSALHRALERADAAVMCAPSDPSTYRLFDASAFAAMQQGAIFCNVSRGATVDEGALAGALTGGHLAAAAIDVADDEPLPPDSALWDVPHLYISPHCAGATEVDHTEGALEIFGANLRRWLRGEPLHNVIALS